MRPRFPRRALVGCVVTAIVTLASHGARAQDPGTALSGDSTAFRLEFGQRTDVTNEQYVEYEELFLDSALVGARSRLASDPERRAAAFVAAGFAGTRGGGATRYRLDSEAQVGDRLSSGRLAGSWRHDSPAGWRWQLDPDAEYRHDRTFDRDRDEWRAALGTRLRRTSVDGQWAGEWRARGDVLRVSGSAIDLLLDRQTLSLGTSLERLGLLGDWRAGYGFAARAFPDSTVRNHLEHSFEAGGRGVLPGGHIVALDARLVSRRAVTPGLLSRDDFRREEVEGEFALLPAPSWGFTFGTDGEAIQYARPDSALYADARRLRARLGLRLDPRRGANTRIEATAERGWSPALPSEEYRELAGGAGVEWFGSGAWWELFARAGRRAPAGAALGIATGVPDGYRFYELEVGADQPLGAGLRLRVTANGRVEEHDDPSMDARSLYVSVELRWLAIPR